MCRIISSTSVPDKSSTKAACNSKLTRLSKILFFSDSLRLVMFVWFVMNADACVNNRSPMMCDM